MNKLKKLLLRLIFPPTPLIPVIVIIAAVMLIASALIYGSEHTVSYVSYALSAYALTVVCLRIPDIIRFAKDVKQNNRLVNRIAEDAEFRVKLSLYASLIFNTAYAALQVGMALRHSSAWFASIAAYYVLLALLRFVLLRDVKGTSGEDVDLDRELKRYRFTGGVLILMNIALAGMVFYITRLGYAFIHHEITTIALAAYTFTAVTASIVNIVKYRRFGRPVFSAARVIGLCAALVSMLTLETAMLAAFGTDNDEAFRRTMTALTGGGICIFILAVAIVMIIRSIKKETARNTNDD